MQHKSQLLLQAIMSSLQLFFLFVFLLVINISCECMYFIGLSISRFKRMQHLKRVCSIQITLHWF